jgi:hypothetical protein
MQYILKGTVTLSSWPISRSHPTATDQCYDLVHQYTYSDSLVCMASWELEEHHVGRRRTDVHTNQPAGSHWRHLRTAVVSIKLSFLFWWYTLWAANLLNVSIVALSKTQTCCQCLCHMAFWHEFWNYVQKPSHNSASSLVPMVRLATLQSKYTHAHSPLFRHCTVWDLFSMPVKKCTVKIYS